jgi:ornithine carbamoyltransferase
MVAMHKTAPNHFLSITDLSATQILNLIKDAIKLKQYPVDDKSPLLHQTMVMLFDKPSLRTRLSFEIGITQLGGHATYLAPDDIKLGIRETIKDSAKVISSMADCIVARVSNHTTVQELAQNSSVPVINAMTDQEHPCQTLADLLTIYEVFGTFKGLKIAYLGDAHNNVTNSLALACGILDMQLAIASPRGYELSKDILAISSNVTQDNTPQQAITDAQVVVTDTWVSMGREAEASERLRKLAPYQVTQELMTQADPKAIFMHCLPAYRGKEVSADVIDGRQSVVFQEAENRLHAQKALLRHVLQCTT